MIPQSLLDEAIEIIEELMFGFPEDDAELLDRAEDLLKRIREAEYGQEKEPTYLAVETAQEDLFH